MSYPFLTLPESRYQGRYFSFGAYPTGRDNIPKQSRKVKRFLTFIISSIVLNTYILGFDGNRYLSQTKRTVKYPNTVSRIVTFRSLVLIPVIKNPKDLK